MKNPPLFQGLNSEESLTVVWNLLFSPSLREYFGTGWSRQWCEDLIAIYRTGEDALFSREYESVAAKIHAFTAGEPRLSMQNPPWSMVSLDMMVGLIPWVSPLFDRGLLFLFSKGKALETHFGDILPIAFILSGGSGNSKDTAFRICAPNHPTRASAEHWLMRAFLTRREQGLHATLSPDEDERTFSLHRYKDQDGIEREVYFETTDSFGREKDDFFEFLNRKSSTPQG
jgi:hypothetical protein